MHSVLRLITLSLVVSLAQNVFADAAIFQGSAVKILKPTLRIPENGSGGQVFNLSTPALGANYTLTIPSAVCASGEAWVFSNGTGTAACTDVFAASETIPLNRGGTAKGLTAAAGGIVYSDSDSFEISSVGTLGQTLVSAGTSAPTWTWGDTVTITSADSPYTLTTATRKLLVDQSGGAITVNIPAAANTGYSVEIITTANSSNLVTLEGNLSETICGSANVKMSGRSDRMLLVANGTNIISGECVRSVSTYLNCDASSSTLLDFHNVISAIANLAVSPSSCSVTVRTGIFSAQPICTVSSDAVDSVMRETRAVPSSATAFTITQREASTSGSATTVQNVTAFNAQVSCAGLR